ncbi:phosphoribosylformylglycinamidine synthase, partial [Candidatus Woesearchaeota archaeon]|nr:phosphoribosylformylglycinamidine synthase [Candidatus Woesearchaeota archaeon]
MASRIEVSYLEGIDSRGDVILKKVRSLMEEGAITRADISSIRVIDAYSVNREFPQEQLGRIAGLLHDPVTQEARAADSFTSHNADYVIEIGFKPGVTDNIANTVRKGIEAKLGERFRDGESVHSSRVLLVRGGTLESAMDIGSALANPLIQNISCREAEDACRHPYIPRVTIETDSAPTVVPIRDMDLETLKTVAKKGIVDPKTGKHRGPLALDSDDAAPMRVIVDHFMKLGRDPSDAELECLAQTWSEHCKHTIFAASLDLGTADAVPEGLYKTYIRGATEKIRETWLSAGKEDFLLSVFRDNSGILEFDGRYALTVKVETHNSPSALDPYGGSITGIVGVDRDAIGAGMGAMPYSHRFFFCFGDPRVQRALYKKKNADGTLDEKMLSHRSIMDGVVEGVKDGGNKSGIPTPQGGAFFHPSYSGKPLVFVGVDGILPKAVAGKQGWKKKADSGDLVVMVGGRVGLDGIHGATFSSEAMDSGSPMGAVQIGDPITQKKLSDAIIKEARDLGLYTSITDNGAGGLSCSVYEMAKECGGATINLDNVPLKYPGMRADEILISESQERMTLAVPRQNLDRFMDIMKKHDVEATVIGEFNRSGKARATFRGETV